VGLTFTRSTEDEAIFRELANASSGKQRPSLYIFDCRSQANATANQAIGKGYEFESYYPGTQLYFLGIENIHAVRDSHWKLWTLCMKHIVQENEEWSFIR
jgi:myotubularin-related protein 1/2